MILSSLSKVTFCQEKREIDIHTKIVQSSSGIYKLIVTFDADSSLYTFSMFHDTTISTVVPIVIDFKEDINLKPLDAWIEQPPAENYNHWVFGEGLYIKQRTNYMRQFMLTKKTNFISYFEITYMGINEKKAEPPRTITFKIEYMNHVFTILKQQ